MSAMFVTAWKSLPWRACGISSITAHWQVHQNHHEKSCEVIYRRHNYLKSLKSKDYWKTDLSAEELERTEDKAGNSLSIQHLMRGKFIAKAHMEFQGKHHLVDNTIIDSILNGDLTVLDEVPEVSSSGNFFETSTLAWEFPIEKLLIPISWILEIMERLGEMYIE